MGTEESVPCTTDGCLSVKFFAGRCNPCQKVLDAADPVPGITDAVVTTTWVEECMAKQGTRVAPNGSSR